MNTNDRDIPSVNDTSIDLRERFKNYYIMIECELNASEITGANRQVLIKELKACKHTYDFGLLALVALRIKCSEMDARFNVIERSILQGGFKMKYELTDETMELDGKTLHRIKALKDFGIVKSGNIGGWVETENNLSQDGNCWIFGNAKVYDNAKVSGDASVFCNAQVFGDAKVNGYAHVGGYARVFGETRISGDAEVFDDANVCGNATISGNAKVYR